MEQMDSLEEIKQFLWWHQHNGM